MTNTPTSNNPATKIIGRIFQGIFYSIAIFLGCHSVQGFLANPEKEARNQITESLRAPSSFKEINSKRIWEGRDKEGRDAFVIKVEYEAMNGFGGINRECQYFAVSREYFTLYWNKLHSRTTCVDPEYEDNVIQLFSGINDFKK